jgi:hypothetical protein
MAEDKRWEKPEFSAANWQQWMMRETCSADRRPDLGHAPGCAPRTIGKAGRAWRGSVQIVNG